MSYLVDSNVLIRLRDLDSPDKPTCERAIRLNLLQGVPTYLCAQVLIEFWAVSTRPREANGLGMSVEEVYSGVMAIRHTLPLLPEPADIAERWLEVVRRYGVQGKAVHDARLVAFALTHGVTRILTLNPDDFRRYTEAAAVTPSQLLERLGA